MDGDEKRLGRPVDFGGARELRSEPLDGRYARLEPLDPARHGDDLWAAGSAPGGEATWDYLPNGPFATRDAFDAWLGEHALQDDPRPFALIDRADGRAKGTACFMRMVPAMGVIEIGYIWMTPPLQRTRASTDAIAVMMRHAFDGLGNRRLEWKCNDLNAASRRAAERYGFTFEGVFRQMMVVKGRNRDTAWYSIIDSEWPAIRQALDGWLAADNFDADGRQKERLSTLMAQIAL